MSEETRMIIITSDDDLIRQLAKNQWQKTHLIELDEEHPASNGNLPDWNLFAELSQLNQTTDQVYQRILSAPVIHRRKSTRRSSNTTCAICGDRAIGFNYDVLSCASCKAFFRRNAQHSLEKLRCISGTQKCSVDHSTTRKCQRCRLQRCLEQGMRKDFILSDAEKERKYQRLEENRQQTTSVAPVVQVQQPNDELSIEDWLDIERIKSSYAMLFDADYHRRNNISDIHDRRSAVASWTASVDRTGMKLIQFFRQLDQFEELNAEDRFFLVKFNLFSVSLVHKSVAFNWRTGTFGNLTPEENQKRHDYFCATDGQQTARDEFFQMLKTISMLVQGDFTVIYLVLIILLFANDSPAELKKACLVDPLAVYRCQCHFIRLLSNYLRQKHGEEKGNQFLARLFLLLARLPSLTEKMQRFFCAQIEANELLENITPLLQTVLNLN